MSVSGSRACSGEENHNGAGLDLVGRRLHDWGVPGATDVIRRREEGVDEPMPRIIGIAERGKLERERLRVGVDHDVQQHPVS
jgi:hypothetical protein